MKNKEVTKKEGITLIALVITIIILLILAGITITAITGENGLLNSALKAKEETEISDERETVDICTAQSMGKDKRGDITKESLQKELDNYTGVKKTEVLKDSTDELYVYFIDTNRYYNVDINGNIEGPVTVNRAEDENPGEITKDKNGNELSGETEEEAYEINCIEDLCALSNSCNNGTNYDRKYIKLMVDLDFKSDLSYVNGKIAVEGNIPSCSSVDELKNILTTGEGFYPIGFKNGIHFYGNFNGKYHEITNLYENFENDGSIYAGLFGDAFRGAKIQNITVEGEISSRCLAGGIAASGSGATFINCINRVDVEGTANDVDVGGICGHSYDSGTFINCANYGEIIGGRFNAGILGWDWGKKSKIYNCINANKASASILRNIYKDGAIQIFNTINTGNCTSVVVGSINQIQNCFNLKSSVSSLGNDKIIEYDETKMKSEEFVNELNSFIETKGNGSNIDTTGWAKWIYNENDFPTLDIKTIWNGTNWISNDN